ncbi:hypothetical protein [Gloeothece citriformis]|uniref:hypothetical protein n=1 Tax=Gloeothece citriformis TaxID=2546356 RepID=UPI0002E01AF7|nr:hypothetical protein [Gloeothece citriformis]
MSGYRLANFNFGVQYYGIALRSNSPLTRKLNEKILSLEMQMRVQEILDNWYRLNEDKDNVQ